MDTFLLQLQLLLSVIGVDFLRKPSTQTVNDTAPINVRPFTRFELFNERKGIAATAVENDGEFVVLAGSTGSLHVGPSFPEDRHRARERAFDTGRAKRLNSHVFELLEDVAFTSPSGAAVFLHGTSRNGRTDWCVEDSTETYADWQQSRLKSAN